MYNSLPFKLHASYMISFYFFFALDDCHHLHGTRISGHCVKTIIIMIHVNATLNFIFFPVLTLFHLAHLNLQPKYYTLLEPLIYIQCKIGAFLDNSLVCPEENQSQSTPPKLNTRYYHRTVFISHEQKKVNSATKTYLILI